MGNAILLALQSGLAGAGEAYHELILRRLDIHGQCTLSHEQCHQGFEVTKYISLKLKVLLPRRTYHPFESLRESILPNKGNGDRSHVTTQRE
jgi:hypothetical protein